MPVKVIRHFYLHQTLASPRGNHDSEGKMLNVREISGGNVRTIFGKNVHPERFSAILYEGNSM